MNKFARSIALSVLLVTAVVGTRPAAADEQQSTDVSSHPWIGKAAPEFSLKKVGGGEMKLDDLEGKYVIIHFGASW